MQVTPSGDSLADSVRLQRMPTALSDDYPGGGEEGGAGAKPEACGRRAGGTTVQLLARLHKEARGSSTHAPPAAGCMPWPPALPFPNTTRTMHPPACSACLQPPRPTPNGRTAWRLGTGWSSSGSWGWVSFHSSRRGRCGPSAWLSTPDRGASTVRGGGVWFLQVVGLRWVICWMAECTLPCGATHQLGGLVVQLLGSVVWGRLAAWRRVLGYRPPLLWRKRLPGALVPPPPAPCHAVRWPPPPPARCRPA